MHAVEDCRCPDILSTPGCPGGTRQKGIGALRLRAALVFSFWRWEQCRVRRASGENRRVGIRLRSPKEKSYSQERQSQDLPVSTTADGGCSSGGPSWAATEETNRVFETRLWKTNKFRRSNPPNANILQRKRMTEAAIPHFKGSVSSPYPLTDRIPSGRGIPCTQSALSTHGTPCTHGILSAHSVSQRTASLHAP